MYFRRVLSVMLVLAVALCTALPLFAQGQDGVEKYDVFGGYSWYRPGGSIPTTILNGKPVTGGTLADFNEGWGAQFTSNLNHWAGLAVEGTGHYNDFGYAHSIGFGPQFRLRREHFTPFAEALLGVQFMNPNRLPEQTAGTFILGGGVDIPVSPRFSIRAIQADYVNTYYNKTSAVGTGNTLNGVRLQAGVVFKFGLPIRENKVGADCAAEPAAVDAGSPVRVSVAANGFLPKRSLSYSYQSNGGKVSGTAATATVDTTGLAPGSYTVTAKVADNGKGTHRQEAICEAGFKVNELPKHAPTLSISAEPTSVVAGDTATITVNGSSADNRPLNYNCTTTAGRLTGSGPTYTLETAGVAEATATVNCTVSDDRNLTASASTEVKVKAKVAAMAPIAKDYGTIEFVRDPKRPTRVDNEAKGELDRYADALAAAPDAKGVLVGEATAKEAFVLSGGKAVVDFAAQRAVNTKDYLTKEKGIDPARIEPRIGSGEGKTVELWIVPAGASFPATGTTVVDQVKVKPVPRIPLKKRAAHRRVHKKAQ